MVDLAVAALGDIALPFPPPDAVIGTSKRCCARPGPTSQSTPVLRRIDVAELYQDVRTKLPDLTHIVVDGPTTLGTTTLDELMSGPVLKGDAVEPIDPNSAVRMLVSRAPGRAEDCGVFLVPLGSSFGLCATGGVLVTLGGSLVLLPRFDSAMAWGHSRRSDAGTRSVRCAVFPRTSRVK